MPRPRSIVAAAIIAVASLGFSAIPAAANNGSGWYDWSHAAIHAEFGRFGGTAVYCAMYIAQQESGHWPFADNGNHHGIFQLSDGKWQSVRVAAFQMGRRPNWYDPRQNARVAMWLYEGSGRSFQQHWAATAPWWCP